MTQFPTHEPYIGEYEPGPRKTSGMAITALILSVLGIIPCCGMVFALIGAIMGVVGVVTIGSDPAVKGRGMSLAAIIIGVLFIGVQIGLMVWGYQAFMEPIRRGPEPALQAGFAGDYNGFRDAFYGPGAAATDEEIEAFIEELRSRYGEFVSSELARQPQPDMGDTVIPAEYRLTFDRSVVDGEAEVILADEQTGAFVRRLGWLRIIDPDQGDLEFPPRQP